MFARSLHFLLTPLFLLSVLLLMLSSVGVASAQTTDFGIRPQAGGSYYELTIAPGETVQDALVVNHSGDMPLQVEIQALRGRTMAAGGISYPDDSSGPAQWVSFEHENIVTVPAASALTVSFRVTVPPDTEAGEYVVGIVATPQEQTEHEIVTPEGETAADNSSFRVQVVTRSAMAMIITVPGETRCKAALTGLQSTSSKGQWQLVLELENQGNVHFRSEGEVIARPAAGGEPIAQVPLKVGYFVAGDAIQYAVMPGDYPAEGDYVVEATLETDCGFEAAFVQPLSISGDDVANIVAEQQAVAGPASVDQEAARLQAQAEWIRSMGLLLGGIAALVLVIVLAVFVAMWLLRRRKMAAFSPVIPRQGGPIRR